MVTTLSKKIFISRTYRNQVALTEEEDIKRMEEEERKNPTPDIALSTSIAMLIAQGYGHLRIISIIGNYTDEEGSTPLTKTKYGATYHATVFHHPVEWGDKSWVLNQSTTLDDIFKEEGPFTIKEMVVLQPYKYNDENKNIFDTVSYHYFEQFSFKPKIFLRNFGKIPSQAIMNILQDEKRKWQDKARDPEELQRMRDTLLLSRVNRNTHPNVYQIWQNRNALVLKEGNTFQEFGLEII